MPPPLDRRDFLRSLSLSPFVVTGVGVFTSAVRAEAKAAGLIAANVCMLQPELTEGPFYIDERLNRADITEGRPGAAMDLALQVVTADCTPVEGARVDVWHCDALGAYSGVSGASDETFLRGTQVTGAGGVAKFRTIYPGWYRGRTTHIHYKVFLGDRTVLTSQVFFPDALSDYLYRSVEPYDGRGRRDTTNDGDRIARQAGEGAYAQVREMPGAYDASLVVGIDNGAGQDEA